MGVLQHEQIGGIADGKEHGVRAWAEAHPGQHTLPRAHLHFDDCGLFRHAAALAGQVVETESVGTDRKA